MKGTRPEPEVRLTKATQGNKDLQQSNASRQSEELMKKETHNADTIDYDPTSDRLPIIMFCDVTAE